MQENFYEGELKFFDRKAKEFKARLRHWEKHNRRKKPCPKELSDRIRKELEIKKIAFSFFLPLFLSFYFL